MAMDLSKYAHLTRQADLIPMEALQMPVNVVGCGAIGSFTVLALAKMGVTNITVWDHDSVSVENMSNQFFRFKDIGHNKASALAMLVHDFTGVQIKAHPRKVEDTDITAMDGILVTAVDSMAVRKHLYDLTRTTSHGLRLVIDPRMGAELYLQYTYNMVDKWYDNCLYTDENAVAERCTAKSTVYTATLAAGLITKTVKNFITKQPYPKTINWSIADSKNPLQMWPNKEKESETSKQ